MALNIKDERLHAQALVIAAREGRSITDVVRRALNEYAAAHPSPEEVARRIAAIHAIQREAARVMTPDLRARTQDDLYDDNGLPA